MTTKTKHILEYLFNVKEKLIIERMHGDIGFEDILSYELRKLNDPNHNDTYNVYVDLRGAVFNISDQEKKIFYSKLLERLEGVNMSRKIALVTDTPYEFIYSYEFIEQINSQTSAIVQIFTSEEAASEWIRI